MVPPAPAQIPNVVGVALPIANVPTIDPPVFIWSTAGALLSVMYKSPSDAAQMAVGAVPGKE